MPAKIFCKKGTLGAANMQVLWFSPFRISLPRLGAAAGAGPGSGSAQLGRAFPSQACKGARY